MFERILQALRQRKDLEAWSLNQATTMEAQLYAVPSGIEARRQLADERYTINVLVCSQDGEGRTCGQGNITLLPGDAISPGIETAVQIAGKVHSQPYDFPMPAEIPDVPLVDKTLVAAPEQALQDIYAEMQAAASGFPGVRMTAAECFSKHTIIHFANSHGIDCSQSQTRVDAEFVLHTKAGGAQAGSLETESFYELSRRRVQDLQIASRVRQHAQYALDLQGATAPPDYHGPVVFSEDVLATFLNGGVLQFLSSAEAKYRQISQWEIGSPVLRAAGNGDPLTVWANRRLPFGLHADRFDEEGVPAQRLLLIDGNHLANRWAKKRYADYLSLPATGSFGDIELPPGSMPAASLRDGPYAEIARFSWFDPDFVTGDFASEIRLGYLVDGERRTPFRGGMLVGNVLDALAAARWSFEASFYGSYQGPATVRFEGLKITAG